MSKTTWWQKAVFYQIYPRSFADGNGDGIGDLDGMIAKLDYLKWLGVDAVWLSPHFPSPQVDCGYDISDYLSVAPEYGTMEKFQLFLDGLHLRGMRLILDLVLNHTSDQHPWFVESRSSRNHPKRDWYVWLPGKADGPPNDWFSTFGGSAWTFDVVSGEYYYHYFFKEQPDLNWHNPEVKAAMLDVVRYWCKLGVDGFRLDAVGTIYETPGYPNQGTGVTLNDNYREYRQATNKKETDAVTEKWKRMFRYQHDLPGIHDLMRELRTVIDEFPDKVLVGETDQLSFYGNGRDELHLNFNFPLMHTQRITPQWVRENQEGRLANLPPGAWPCNTLGNHDVGRMRSEFGDGENDERIGRVNLALILTLWGTPFLYNGEEIGMTNHLGIRPEQFRDPLSRNALDLELNLIGSDQEEAQKFALLTGRDKTRTPMQWSADPNAGFCPAEIEPWLPVQDNFSHGVNVHDQMNDPHSLLNFYQKMITLRKGFPALQEGVFEVIDQDNPYVFTFLRKADTQTCLVALNMCAETKETKVGDRSNFRSVFSTHHPIGKRIFQSVELLPFEILIGVHFEQQTTNL